MTVFDSTSEPQPSAFTPSQGHREQTLMQLLFDEFLAAGGQAGMPFEKFLDFAERYLDKHRMSRVEPALDATIRVTITNGKEFLLAKGSVGGDMEPSHAVPVSGGQRGNPMEPSDSIKVL